MNLINSLKKVRQIKSLFILSSALVVSLSTFSCKDNDDRYVTPDITISSEVVDNTILFEKTGGEKSFSIKSNRPWKVEVNADWVSVSPTSGNEGDTRISVKTLDNSNGIDREANIKISSTTIVKNIVVRQEGMPGTEITSFNVNFEGSTDIPTGWESVVLEGSKKWIVRTFNNNNYIAMTAYKATGNVKSMLISPKVSINSDATLKFRLEVRYAAAGTMLKVVLLDQNKKQISELKSYELSTNQDFKDQLIDIPANANAKYVAFLYEGDATKTAYADIDDIILGPKGGVEPTPTPEPTPSGDAVDNFNVNFEGLAQNTLPQGWTNVNKEGTKTWRVGTYSGNSYVQMTSHNSKGADKVMLVSPKVSILKDATLSFRLKVRYAVAGTLLKVLLLDESKNQIGEIHSYDLSTDKEFESQSIDVSANANAKYIAFLYEGDPVKKSTAQLDDIVLAPKGGVTPTPTPDPQPTPEPTPTPDPTPVAGDVDIFIHAYSEGSSMNKYVVLYNPKDSEVDLSAYKLACDQWTSKGNYQGVVSSSLSGTISAKGFKVFSHTSAASYTGGETDKSASSIFQFNGDDAIALLKSDDSVVDVFGPYLKNQRWLDGNKGVAADKTFIRKSSVSKPAKEYNAEEWDIVDMNDFSRFTTR